MTPRTARNDELKDLWVSFAGRGGGYSKFLILKIYEILQSAEDGKGRVSRQELRERLLNEYYNEKRILANLDRIMRKLEYQQLIRKEIETKLDARTPNKIRTYYRINLGLVHRAVVPEGSSSFIVPCYCEDPSDPKNGDMWLIDPEAPHPPPARYRKTVRVPVYHGDPQKPRNGEGWINCDV